MPSKMPRRMRKASKKPYKKKPTLKRKAMRGDDTHTVYIKSTVLLTPVQGLTSSNYIYQHFSPSPDYLSPQQTCPLFALPEFTLWRNMYDKFRVTGMGISVKPRYNSSEMSQLINRQDQTQPQSQTEGSGTIYHTIDTNGWAPSSIPQLKKYGSCKVNKIFNSFKRGYNVKYASNVWLDSKNPAGSSDLMTNLGLRGGITLLGYSFPEVRGTILNTAWADVEVTYKVVFKAKTLAAMSTVSLGDGLYSVTLSPHDAIANLAPSLSYVIDDANPLVGQVDPSDNVILPI